MKNSVRLFLKASVLVAAFFGGLLLFYPRIEGIRNLINPPVLVVADADIDVGTLAAGVKAMRTVRVTNRGGAILRIDSVKSSCGCTEVFLEQPHLAPGASTDLSITVTGMEVPSDDAVAVMLLSNDPASPATRIKLRFGSVSDVMVVPPQIDFGSVRRSDLPAHSKCRILTRNGRVTALDFDNPTVTVSDSFLKVKVAESPKESSGRAFDVTVELPAEAPSGELYSKLSISDDRTMTSLRLEVFGNVKGALYAVPVMLDFGKISAESDTVIEKISVKQRGGDDSQPVVIHEANMSDSLAPFIQSSPFADSDGQGVKLRLSPQEYEGVWSNREVFGYFRVRCEVAGIDGTQEWVNVPIRMKLRTPRIRD